MTLSIELKKESPDDWNAHLLKSRIGNIFNTKEYAEYAEKYEGWDPIFCRVADSSGNVILQTLLFEYTPNIDRIPTFLHGLIRHTKRSIRWNYGPVSDSPDAISMFFSQLKKLGKKIYGTTHPLSSLEYNYFNRVQWSTFLIDLTKSKEELYGNLSKHNARKNIERAIEREATIEEIRDERSLEEYILLLDQYRKSMSFDGVNSDALIGMWRILKPVGFSGFIARKNGAPIGGLLFSFFNNYVNEWGVARSNIDNDEKLYSQDLIKWKIIEWGIEHKMNWYDLSGVNSSPTSKKEEGILQYKKKWGGIQKDYWIISGGS